MKTDRLDKGVRERLLDTAEVLFAADGYDHVSIRDITRYAQCNLAAVNYYFKGKQGLYLDVFRHHMIPRARRIRDFFWKRIKSEKKTTVETVVRALTEAYMHGPLSQEEVEIHHKLMARELTNPTTALDMMVEDVIRPFVAEVSALLRPDLKSISDEELLLDVISVFALILYFTFGRLPISKVTGKEYTDKYRDKLVEHVTSFSLYGLGCNIKDKGT